MTTITRRFEFDAGHRVLGHEGKCKHLHGHRYVAEVTVTARDLDDLGRVIDFSVLKDKVGGWIDENWDHNLLVHREDPILAIQPSSAIWGGKDPYLMPNGNPTAENIAYVLFKKTQSLLGSYSIEPVHVRVYETPNCWADFSLTEEI
jgi:6-pyruvoyltetrahydropterin/6-carboxytetrahydropterin synthase